MADLTALSKFLSLMLRHRAADFGLALDADGFTSVDVVWSQVVKKFGERYTWVDLLEVVEVAADSKQRFEIVNGRIRARYGHSAVRTISYPPVTPPELLYHGTTPETLDAIRREGLRPQSRQFVHLSLDESWARRVGARHSAEPLVLRVYALAAYQAGCVFHHPEPKHFLTLAVPPEFIDFADG